MSEVMLGNLRIPDVRRSMTDLEDKLAGDDGVQWLVALNRFLRKENPWAEFPLWRVINATTIEVNLDVPSSLSFDGATVEWTTPGQTGWVRVEKKDNQLFVDGRKVDLHITEGQKTARDHQGHNLFWQLKGKAVLHPNIADALFENPHLFPDSWKLKDQGWTVYVYFWAVGYRHAGCNICVRCVYFGDAGWSRYFLRLHDYWGSHDPAAVLAS